MPTILAIETSSEIASAALLCGERVIVRESAGVHTHSHTMLPMVQNVLSEGGVLLAQCDVIAFGCGPGSFTGVRTACGIVQGMAFGANLPVMPVVTLLAMAEACRAANGAVDVLTVLDARMGEVYWAQYRYADGWQTVIEPTLSTAENVMPQGQVFACGNGLQAYAAAFEQCALIVNAQPQIMPHAGQIAQLARIAFSQGLMIPAREAQPLYLRNKVALTIAERQVKTERVEVAA